MLDLNTKIEQMSIEELREFTRKLIRLARVDAELIRTMQDVIELIENQEGE